MDSFTSTRKRLFRAVSIILTPALHNDDFDAPALTTASAILHQSRRASTLSSAPVEDIQTEYSSLPPLLQRGPLKR
ncbi:hypothetical protein H9L39_01507 [Fusarium oxysporum f. sp. albedinis]|nr:hypothetical protein H9L39_01507 [Fusarium oxysporum f. sp. albedinis]